MAGVARIGAGSGLEQPQRPRAGVPTSLTVLAGMPGSGKSHWRRDFMPGVPVLTLDGARGAGWGDGLPGLLRRAVELLAAGDVVADVTAVKQTDRAEWLRVARAAGALPKLVVFTTPAAVCIARNRRRPDDRRVPDDRMQWYAAEHARLVELAAREPWVEVRCVDGR